MRTRKVFLNPFGLIGITGALAVTLTISSSRGAPPQASRDEQIKDIEEKKELAKAAIGVLNRDKSCVGDSECEVLEMGAKSCGGPSGFVIYSSTGRNATAIKNKAQEVTKLEKEINSRGGALVTDCSSLTIPDAHCVKAQCVAKDGK